MKCMHPAKDKGDCFIVICRIAVYNRIKEENVQFFGRESERRQVRITAEDSAGFGDRPH